MTPYANQEIHNSNINVRGSYINTVSNTVSITQVTHSYFQRGFKVTSTNAMLSQSERTSDMLLRAERLQQSAKELSDELRLTIRSPVEYCDLADALDDISGKTIPRIFRFCMGRNQLCKQHEQRLLLEVVYMEELLKDFSKNRAKDRQLKLEACTEAPSMKTRWRPSLKAFIQLLWCSIWWLFYARYVTSIIRKALLDSQARIQSTLLENLDSSVDNGVPLHHIQIDDFFGAQWFLPQVLCLNRQVFFSVLRFKFQGGPAESVIVLEQFGVFRQGGLRAVQAPDWENVIKKVEGLQLSVLINQQSEKAVNNPKASLQCPHCKLSDMTVTGNESSDAWVTCLRCDKHWNLTPADLGNDNGFQKDDDRFDDGLTFRYFSIRINMKQGTEEQISDRFTQVEYEDPIIDNATGPHLEANVKGNKTVSGPQTVSDSKHTTQESGDHQYLPVKKRATHLKGQPATSEHTAPADVTTDPPSYSSPSIGNNFPMANIFVDAYTDAAHLPVIVWDAFEKSARDSNIMYPSALRLLKTKAPNQLWLVCSTQGQSEGKSVDFVLSCIDGPVISTLPIFIFSTKIPSELTDDFLRPRLSSLVDALRAGVASRRVFSIFALDIVSNMFAQIWTKTTGIAAYEQPYYHSMLSYCTRDTIKDAPITAPANHVYELRRATQKDLQDVASLCHDYAQNFSEPYTLEENEALAEAKHMIDNQQVWVHAINNERHGGHSDEIACIVAVTRESPAVSAITKIYTDPKHRGKGCAERLLSEVTQRLLEERESVVIYVAHENLAARKVYDRVGFVGPSVPGVHSWIEIGFDTDRVDLGHWF